MKKLVLSIAILAVMTFAACSEDEKDYTPHYTQCQHCDIPEEDGYEVCTGENGNAYVGNADTGIVLEQYFSLFCANDPVPPGTDTTPGEPTDECITCTTMDIPQEVCKGTNGHAFLEDTDTGMTLNQFIQLTEQTGGSCE